MCRSGVRNAVFYGLKRCVLNPEATCCKPVLHIMKTASFQ